MYAKAKKRRKSLKRAIWRFSLPKYPKWPIPKKMNSQAQIGIQANLEPRKRSKFDHILVEVLGPLLAKVGQKGETPGGEAW